METNDFDKLLETFITSDIDGKIKIYTETEGLKTEQYKQLLKNYPLDKLNMLEAALA